MFGKIARKMERSALFCYKGVMFAVIFAIFFVLFGLREPELMRASRTSAISMSIFTIAGVCLIKIYGGIPIGVKKSKEIIYPMFIAIGLTDALTYFQLAIMRINFENVSYGGDILMLLLVVVLQLLAIYAMTYFGHFLYFKINPPKKAVIVYGEKDGLAAFASKVNKYKKQYQLIRVIAFDDDELRAALHESQMVFLYGLSPNDKDYMLEYCFRHNRDVLFTPELSDIITKCAHTVIIDDVAVLSSKVRGLSLEQAFVKRAMDIFISGVGLIIAGPIMLIEALLIKLEDGGPVFFKQPRVTKDGKIFNVLKFRTMIVDADKNNKRLASQGDSRITKVGNVLRKLRIDELPQFINILKGEMSLVGPRPEQAEITEKYLEVLPEFKYRLKVKAGLTGLAQIQGKYNTTPKDKLMLDLIYIEQYSIWIDIKLILQTAKVLFKSDSTEGVIGELPIDLPDDVKEEDDD